jgi:aspartate racemase
MTKHIGIVACSAEGAALCYRTICCEGADLLGRHMHPEITMHTHPLGIYMRFIEAGRWNGVADLMLSSASILKRAGADFLISPDNTIHQVFDEVARSSELPWLHIAEAVAEEAARRGYECLGILGTRHLMAGPVYSTRLRSRGIDTLVPGEAERVRINEIIFNELVYGRFRDESRDYFSQVISSLGERGCDAVVLGCTEIPLLVSDSDSPVPTLDSTRLLARAALREATAGDS